MSPKFCINIVFVVPRETGNNAYAKCGGGGGTNKDYYGIFRSGLLTSSLFLLSSTAWRLLPAFPQPDVVPQRALYLMFCFLRRGENRNTEMEQKSPHVIEIVPTTRLHFMKEFSCSIWSHCSKWKSWAELGFSCCKKLVFENKVHSVSTFFLVAFWAKKVEAVTLRKVWAFGYLKRDYQRHRHMRNPVMGNEKNGIQEWAGVLQCASVQHTIGRFSF